MATSFSLPPPITEGNCRDCMKRNLCQIDVVHWKHAANSVFVCVQVHVCVSLFVCVCVKSTSYNRSNEYCLGCAANAYLSYQSLRSSKVSMEDETSKAIAMIKVGLAVACLCCGECVGKGLSN